MKHLRSVSQNAIKALKTKGETMQKKDSGKAKVGFKPIVGAIRYTIKKGNKTKHLDVIKARIPNE